MPEKKIKHLEMIEAIIERMAKNSFQLKGWTMTLLTIAGAIAAQGSDRKFILLAFVPIFGFWILDTFYLQQERRYKQLYKNVAVKAEEDVDFNLDTNNVTGTDKEIKKLSFHRCIFSVSEICFYPVITGTLIILLKVLKLF